MAATRTRVTIASYHDDDAPATTSYYDAIATRAHARGAEAMTTQHTPTQHSHDATTYYVDDDRREGEQRLTTAQHDM